MSLESGFYREQRAAHIGLASLEASLVQQGFSCAVVSGDEAEGSAGESGIFGLSVLDHTYLAAQKLTEKLKGKTVIWGGQTATALAERVLLDNPGVDYVVHGEGEKRLCDLLGALRDGGSLYGIDGLSFRDGEGAIVTRPPEGYLDLDGLPMPGPLAAQEGLVYVELSRGCYGRCRYCQESGRMRFKSTEKTLDEMARWYDGGHRTFYVGDANSLSGGERLTALVKGMEARGLAAGIYLVGRPDDVVRNIDALESAFASGVVDLRGVEVGVEADSAHALALLGRTTSPELNRKAVESLLALRDRHSPGTAIYANMILFSHYDMTLEDFAASVRFIGDYDLSREVTALRLVGLAGTPVWHDMKARGFAEDGRFGYRIAEYPFSDPAVERLYGKLVREPLARLAAEGGLTAGRYREFLDGCYDRVLEFHRSPDIGGSLARFIGT